jgi:hypothetical protein
MKPGIKTTEFWLSVAAIIIGALQTAGVFGAGNQWVGAITAALASLGYASSRGTVKAVQTLETQAPADGHTIPGIDDVKFVPLGKGEEL